MLNSSLAASCFADGRLPELSNIYCRPEKEYKALLHAHSAHLEIIYVKSGQGEEIIGDRCYHVSQGDLMVINGSTLHGENPLSVSSFMTYSFLYRNVRLKDRPANCLLPVQAVPVIKAADRTLSLEQLVLTCYQMLADPTLQTTAQMLAVSLLTCLYEEGSRILQGADPASRRGNLLVAEIQQYISQNFASNLTLETLAGRFHTSPYYLSHLFTRYIGCPPIRYLTLRRVGEAQIRLQNTSAAIADIAQDVGFASPSYFNHIFQAYTKMTPTRYRQLSVKPGERVSGHN